MSTKSPALFGPSTMPVVPPQDALVLHIKASLQFLVDRSR